MVLGYLRLACATFVLASIWLVSPARAADTFRICNSGDAAVHAVLVRKFYNFLLGPALSAPQYELSAWYKIDPGGCFQRVEIEGHTELEFGFTWENYEGKIGYVTFGSSDARETTEISETWPSSHKVCVNLLAGMNIQGDWNSFATCPAGPEWHLMPLSFGIKALGRSNVDMTYRISPRRSDEFLPWGKQQGGVLVSSEIGIFPPDIRVFRRSGKPWQFGLDSAIVPASVTSAISLRKDVPDPSQSVLASRRELANALGRVTSCKDGVSVSTKHYDGPVAALGFEWNFGGVDRNGLPDREEVGAVISRLALENVTHGEREGCAMLWIPCLDSELCVAVRRGGVSSTRFSLDIPIDDDPDRLQAALSAIRELARTYPTK